MAQPIKIDKSMPIGEAVKHAADLAKNGEMCLKMADEIYRQILPRIADGPEKGKVSQAYWNVAQAAHPNTTYFSQAGQDHWLEENLFKGKRDGTFAEIGAYDGQTGSNCLHFEAARGWTGFMVEPSPALMAKARAVRRCPGVECAVGPEEGEAEFLHVLEGYTMMSGLAEHFDPGMKATVQNGPGHKGEMLQVPVRRLDDLLDEHGLAEVDFISLDVEGAEVAILSSFPFDKYRVTAWAIENNTGTPEIPKIMAGAGYDLRAHIGVDQIFVVKGD